MNDCAVKATCPVCRGRGVVLEHFWHPKAVKQDRYTESMKGWLALSPDGYTYAIGVVGESEPEAIRKWYEAANRWEELGRLAAATKKVSGD